MKTFSIKDLEININSDARPLVSSCQNRKSAADDIRHNHSRIIWRRVNFLITDTWQSGDVHVSNVARNKPI